MILRWFGLQKPIAHAEKALGYVEKVFALVQERSTAHPELGVYSWLIPQLEYIKSVLFDPNADRSKLHKIDFGIYGQAGETLEMSDPELFEALAGVIYIARRIADGQEIDLQELEDSLKRLSLFETNKML